MNKRITNIHFLSFFLDHNLYLNAQILNKLQGIAKLIHQILLLIKMFKNIFYDDTEFFIHFKLYSRKYYDFRLNITPCCFYKVSV